MTLALLAQDALGAVEPAFDSFPESAAWVLIVGVLIALGYTHRAVLPKFAEEQKRQSEIDAQQRDADRKLAQEQREADRKSFEHRLGKLSESFEKQNARLVEALIDRERRRGE